MTFLTQHSMSHLEANGWVKIKVSGIGQDVLRINASALEFFLRPSENKKIFQTKSRMEGFLEYGSEKDKETGREDLSESYRMWPKNIGNHDVEAWANKSPLHAALRKFYPGLIGIAAGVLSDIRNFLVELNTQESLNFYLDQSSYIQLNFSKPGSEKRDTITDLHEDGHLLTIIKPLGPGLVGSPGILVSPPSRDYPAGKFLPKGDLAQIQLEEDEVAVLASGPTYHLTGGRIPPCLHRVNRSEEATRLSVVLFVNPGPEVQFEPWRPHPSGHLPDLQAMINGVTQSHYLRHQWEDPVADI